MVLYLMYVRRYLGMRARDLAWQAANKTAKRNPFFQKPLIVNLGQHGKNM